MLGMLSTEAKGESHILVSRFTWECHHTAALLAQQRLPPQLTMHSAIDSVLVTYAPAVV